MLTADLVQTSVRRGKVVPRYLDTANTDFLALADTLIQVFKTHQGGPRHALEAELKDLLGAGTSFLLHRGLAKLLYDRCEFATTATVEPPLLRQAIFEAAAESYQGAGPREFDRGAVLDTVAARFALSPEAVEQGLYADLKEEQTLEAFKSCTAEWLLKRYNVALAQAVLLKAARLSIQLPRQKATRYRDLFRQMKFCQLLYRVEGTAVQGYRLTLDGPLSLFKSAQKYGLQMASFLPTLLHAEGWSLHADVLWGRRREELEFKLDANQGLEPHSHSRGQWQPDEIRWLEERFPKLGSNWQLSTDAELVDLGGEGVLVPDYVFEHKRSGRRVVMEIFGFWRRGAIESRLRLLKEHGPENLILALGKQLRVDDEDLEDVPGEVYVFREAPVAREVLKLLEAFEA